MNNKTLYKIANISGWMLLIMLILYFISGYAMVHKYGMDALMNRPQAMFWHNYLTIPFFILLVLHVVPYYIIRKQLKRLLIISLIIFSLPVLGVYAVNKYVKEEIKPPVKSQVKQNQTIKCPHCPNECILKQNETGECGQYKNIDGKLIKQE